MNIVPGYDFSAHEIPSHVKFALDLAGISISGVDVDQIDIATIGERIGDTGLSLPTQGWLWLDPLNRLWIKNEKGPVQLHRANWGGWETNRFAFSATAPTGFGFPTLMGITHYNLTSANAETSYSSVGMNPNTTATLQYLTAGETGVTNLPARAVGRGAFGAKINTNPARFPAYLKPASTASVWDILVLPKAYNSGPTIALHLDYRNTGGIRTAIVWSFGSLIEGQ